MSKTKEQFLSYVLFRFSDPPLNLQEFAMPQNLLVRPEICGAGRCSLMSFPQIKLGLPRNWRVPLLWRSPNPLIYIYSMRNSVYTGSQQPVATPYQAQPSKTSMEMNSHQKTKGKRECCLQGTSVYNSYIRQDWPKDLDDSLYTEMSIKGDCNSNIVATE